ncbi:MAG TPA: PQQ-binding-like beta-propeller repeat protein [Candidatus Dormibacteraeota bacterium]|nr:PQQ-binding-like beta-propeller repeat protein [Candidatus Dormibacteraeota bacterium]
MRQHLATRFGLGLAIATLVLAVQVPALADWPTYHNDAARTGYDPTAPALSNSVNQQWARTGLDADVYAEPLVYGTMVLVATEANTVYALDAATGNILWSKNYGIAVPNAQLPCGNIDPVGITGTPVIDTALGRMYFIGLMWDGTTPSTIHYQLEAINLNASGTELWNRTIAPTDPTYTFDVFAQGQRSALSLASGNIYIPFGGRAGDCGNYRGWVVGAPVSGTGTPLSFPLPTGVGDGAGGFWASSGGAMDASNNLYVTSGNARGTTTFDYGESVLKLSPTLALADYFAPSDWASLNQFDTDLGSVGPTLLGNNLLFQVGKAGVGYLLDITNLGGGTPAHDTPRFSAQVCNATADAAFGGVAYSAPYLYVPCSDHLEALTVNTGATPSFTTAWSGPAGSIGPPIIAGGLVWTMGWNTSRLYGLLATTGEVRLSVPLPLTPMHFATPSSGDGLIFVPDGSQILAYGSACGAASTRQYSLTASDGVNWTPMDAANLQQTLTPSASQWALLEANADLWTGRAGFNQDIGIFVSTNGGVDTLVGWKESGGYGGTFSPNAAFLQVPFAVTSGSTYVVKLKWKTNRDARPTGATIYAGAGTAGPYSHTSLSARLIPTASLQTSAVTTQSGLAGNDGATWTGVGTGNPIPLTPTANSTAILGANADLWTASAGYNQDLGIFVSVNGAADSLVAWKESGGFAGTFSPNAAFVQTVYPMTAGTNYIFKLKWKTNKRDPGAIYAGAGPIGGQYSPTRLTAEVLPAGTNPHSNAITTQQFLTSSNGATWVPVSAALDQTIAPTARTVVMLSGNADLWTATAGYNQDLGIFVSIGGAPDELVAWKESGGFNGTFSPNAAFVQSPFVMSATTSYRFSLKWKTNRPAPGVTIYMGAGGGPYSPTRLTADIVSC